MFTAKDKLWIGNQMDFENWCLFAWGGSAQYRILKSNQLNYREIGVAPTRVARIAEAL